MIKRIARPLPALVALAAALTLTTGAAAQDGLPQPAYSEPGSNETLMDRSDLGNVAQTARFNYAEGERELKKAAKLEKKLAAADESKRVDIEAKITASYEKAVAKFTEAIRNSPKMLEAYTALGETFGKLGKHRERLQVHSAALKVAPGDEASFRGWAGALLELDMLGDATRAWDHFHASDPSKADILMTEMRGWLERHRSEPGDIAPEAIERMADWMAERG